jgi:peptide deformylase
MAPYRIRIFGDPVLKQRAAEVTSIDGRLVQLSEDMITTLRGVAGLGLAAPQVGVQKRLFVYQLDDDDEPAVLINPVISDFRGEWEFDEGCLSLPGLYFPIVRPKEVHLTGYDLQGREVSIEADELLARLLQHELDHLEGRLLLEYLDHDQRKSALKELRRREVEGDRTAGRMVRAGTAGDQAPDSGEL